MSTATRQALTTYRRKRDFVHTAEPSGEATLSLPGQRHVMHKHAASQDHYDLRLEEDSVLRSWALPVLHLGRPDAFLDHASREELLAECGLDVEGIRNAILDRWPQAQAGRNRPAVGAVDRSISRRLAFPGVV